MTSAVSTPRARPLSIDSLASSSPLSRSSTRPATIERGRRVEDPDVAPGALLPLEHGTDHAGVEGGVAAQQIGKRRRGKAERPWIHPPPDDLECARAIAADLQHVGGRRHTQLVEPVVGMDDQRVPAPRRPEDARHDGRHGRIADPDQLTRGPCGVGQRPEEVEHGWHAELLADRPNETHRRVEALGETEPHAGRGDAARHTFGSELYRHTERLQHVGRPHRRRRGAVAVLAHRHAAPCRDEGRQRRHVDARQAVAACPHQVDRQLGIRLVEWAGHGGLDHGPGQAGDFLGRLALGVQQ